MTSTTVSNWSDFLEAVRLAKNDLCSPEALWFRGHSRSNYRLVPSLYRKPQWQEKEMKLFLDYERYSFEKALSQDSWKMLQDMQHYGIPTRLFDWTEVLGVALAFALLDSVDSVDEACIYILNPSLLNTESGINGVQRVGVNHLDFDYKSIYWQGKPLSPASPIAIDGRLHNDRLRAQRGTFSVHGRNTSPLDEQVPHAVRKILLSASAKIEAREFLEFADFTPLTIYPDSAGMARHLNNKYFGGR